MTISSVIFSALIALLVPSYGQANDEIVDTRRNPAIEQALLWHVDQLIEKSIEQNRWNARDKHIAIALPKGSHRLAPCSKPLEITRRDNRLYPAGRLRFLVQCQDKKPWSINVQAEADLVIPMVYVTRTIAKDSLIERGDLRLEDTHLATLNRDFVTQVDSVIGQRALRQIRNGQRLSPARFSQAYLVNRGDNLIIEAIGDTFSASMQGTALDNGYINQQIRVRNSSSGKTIRAVVVESGKVQTLF
jgi:flagella basal body P-ring formation protein FlgA